MYLPNFQAPTTFFLLKSQYLGFVRGCLWSHVVQPPPSVGTGSQRSGLSNTFCLPRYLWCQLCTQCSARDYQSTFLGQTEYRDVPMGLFHVWWGIPSSLPATWVWQRDLREAIPCACAQPLMSCCRSSWQLGARWLSSAEVRPVSRTYRLL